MVRVDAVSRPEKVILFMRVEGEGRGARELIAQTGRE